MHKLHTSAVKKTCKDFYTKKQIEAWLKGRSPKGYHDGINKEEMYIAEDNGKIIGFGHAIPGEIAAIYVDPTFNKKGIGKLLLNHGLKIALKNHKKIKVNSTLNAEKFYKKHGFVKIKDDTVTKNGIKVPIIVMEYSPKSLIPNPLSLIPPPCTPYSSSQKKTSETKNFLNLKKFSKPQE